MNSPRRTLLIIATLFATPVLVALLLYKYPGIVSFTGTKNHGTLIQPPRPVDSLQLTNSNNEPVTKQALEGRWTYVVLAYKTCDTACAERLYKTRQVRHALGKDMDRAQRLLISLDETSKPTQEQLDANQDMMTATATNLATVTSLFASHREGNAGRESPDALIDRIYLIDPQGNLMMSYTEEIEGRLILKDLQRLVRVSWIKPK